MALESYKYVCSDDGYMITVRLKTSNNRVSRENSTRNQLEQQSCPSLSVSVNSMWQMDPQFGPDTDARPSHPPKSMACCSACPVLSNECTIYLSEYC